jgi:hypothetical protein
VFVSWLTRQFRSRWRFGQQRGVFRTSTATFQIQESTEERKILFDYMGALTGYPLGVEQAGAFLSGIPETNAYGGAADQPDRGRFPRTLKIQRHVVMRLPQLARDREYFSPSLAGKEMTAPGSGVDQMYPVDQRLFRRTGMRVRPFFATRHPSPGRAKQLNPTFLNRPSDFCRRKPAPQGRYRRQGVNHISHRAQAENQNTRLAQRILAGVQQAIGRSGDPMIG